MADGGKNNYERDCFAKNSCIRNTFSGSNILFDIFLYVKMLTIIMLYTLDFQKSGGWPKNLIWRMAEK